MKKILIISLLTIGLSHSLFAKGRRAKTNKQAPYGMAGCGLGALLIQKNETLPQVGAMLLNNFYGNQTFGITSGTSNCVESRTMAAAMEQEVFITANLNTLQKEASTGTGEHLEGLAEVLGCTKQEEKVRLGQLCQEEYNKIFSTQEPNTVLENILSAIERDAVLRTRCKKVS